MGLRKNTLKLNKNFSKITKKHPGIVKIDSEAANKGLQIERCSIAGGLHWPEGLIL